MTEIALRTYNQEIKDLIDHGHFDEAIAHCQHILETFPRHIETYRLLGKAFLEQGRHGDAADVFQRVLSAIPEDWLSHVAMAIVREDESNLDMAIWHMERAYEVNPSNPTVQQEVRRLRGRRDGVEPPKLRLTRSALARMYIKGGLFGQAIAEIRSALAEDADRPDLQTLLASALFESGAIQEATDICSTILQKLPYCLEANRVLGLALWGSEKKEDAEKIFQRLESLDPYIDLDALKKDKRIQELPGQSITLTRIEWEQQEKTVRSKQPAWASSLGLKIEEPQGRPAIPDWLASASQPAAPATPAAPASAAPFGGPTPSWFNDAASAIGTGKPAGTSQIGIQTPPAKPAAIPAVKTGTGELPDWIKTQSTSAEPPAAVKPSGPLPDWLAAPSTPPAPNAETAAPTTESTLPDWIRTAAPASTAPAEKMSGIPDWLSTPTPPSVEALPPSSLPEWTKPETKTGPLEVEPGNIPDWLSSTSPASADAGSEPEWLKAPPAAGTVSDSIPDWMKIVSPVEPPSATPAVLEKVPDWLQENPVAASKPVEIVPEWMRSESPPAAEARMEKPSTPFGPESDIPEWMKPDISETPAPSAAHLPAPIPETDSFARMISSEPGKPSLSAEPAPEIGLPDWMVSQETPAPAAPAVVSAPAPEPPVESAVEIVPEVTLPDWLTASAPPMTAKPAAVPQAPTPPPPAQPVPAEAAAFPLETMPDWLRDAAPPPSATPVPTPAAVLPTPPSAQQVESVSEIVPEVTLPDWLSAVAPPAPPKPAAVAPAPVQPVAVPAIVVQPEAPAEEALDVALPDWLKGVAQSTPTVPSIAAAAPVAPAPVATAAAPAPAAAGLPETAPEAIPEINLPDWIKTSAPAVAQASAPVAQAEPNVAAEPKPLSAPAQIVPPIPAPIPIPEAPAAPELDLMGSTPISEGIDLPDWLVAQLKGKPPEPAPNLAAAKPAVPMPDWLKPSTQNLPPEPVVDWEKAASQSVPSVPADATRPATGATPPAERPPAGSAEIPAWLDKSKPSGNETVARWLDRRLKTSTLSSLDDAALRSGMKPPSAAQPPPARPAQSSTQLPTWLDSQKPGGSDTVVRWMDKRETGSLRRTPTSAFADAGKTAFPAAAGAPAANQEVPQAPPPAKPSTGGLGTEDTFAPKKPAAPEAAPVLPPVSEQPRPAAPVPAPMSPEQALRTPHLAKLATGALGTEATLASRKPALPEEEEEDGGFVPPPEWLQKALGSAVEDVPPIPRPQAQAPVPEVPKPQPPPRTPTGELPVNVRWQAATAEEPAPEPTAKPAPWVPITPSQAAPEAGPKPGKKPAKKKTRKLSDIESEAMIREARVYLDSDLQKATDVYQKVIENPTSAEVVANDLTTYLEQDPASPQLWNLLGDACSRAGRFQDAYKAYAEALRRM